MKKIIKSIGLMTLICFSFFYTDKVMEVINEQDPIMIKLTEIKDEYYSSSVDATIIGNTIVPGLNGQELDVDASYKNMKQIGVFKTDLIKYTETIPEVSITSNKDKYIIKGNKAKQMVSLVFAIKSNSNLTKLEQYLSESNIKTNYFIDYTYLNNNLNTLKKLSNKELYSYGDNSKYSPDILLFSNNLIKRISNDASYCLVAEESGNDSTLELCKSNNMYTILPTIIADTRPYSTIKNNLEAGSIILLETDAKTIEELPVIVDFITGKGLTIGYLSELLTEKKTT